MPCLTRLRQFVILAFVTGSACLMSGCHSPSPAPGQPELSFTRYQPIYLNVSNINIVEEYKSPMKEPNVEHLLPITPVDGVRAWVRDRIRPVGLDKTLQVIIKDASVLGHVLPTPEGMSGLFSNVPDQQYDARLEVELRIYNTDAMSEAGITIVATQMNTINQSATVEERKKTFKHMIGSLMESANAELEKQIFQYFNKSIIYAQTP